MGVAVSAEGEEDEGEQVGGDQEGEGGAGAVDAGEVVGREVQVAGREVDRDEPGEQADQDDDQDDPQQHEGIIEDQPAFRKSRTDHAEHAEGREEMKNENTK